MDRNEQKKTRKVIQWFSRDRGRISQKGKNKIKNGNILPASENRGV